MKTPTTRNLTPFLTHFAAGLCLALSLLGYNAGAAVAIQWWDDNGTSVATGGTWDTATASWASSSALTASTATFTSGNVAAFAAGTATIASLAISVPNPVTCAGISNATTGAAILGTLTFSGPGPITIASGVDGFYCGTNGGASMVINTPITGAGQLVQHASGQLSLYGVNTYSGGTTMTGGQIINYNNNASFGSGTITVTGGSGAVVNNSGAAMVITNPFSFSAANFNLNLVGGAAVAGAPGTTFSGPINLGPAGITVLYTGGSGSPSVDLISGVISGAASLTTEDYGNLELSATNTYTGNTAINNALGTPTLTITGAGLLGGSSGNYSGTIANTGTFIYNSSASQTLAGVISGAGTFTVNGTGKLTLSGANTFTGPLNISSGTVVVNAGSPVGGAVTVSGGSLATAGNIAGAVTVSGGILTTVGNIAGSVTVSGGTLDTTGVIAGNNVTVSSGTLDVQTTGSFFGNNITVTGGNLELDNANAISNQLATVFLPASPNSMFLNYVGTDYILALNVGGASLATGTWGAAGSGAAHTNSAFSGTGLLSVTVSSGTNFYWDANGSDAVSAHSDMGGGSGNWDNSTADWWVSGGADTAWIAGYAASFGGTAGTVTVADNVAPGSLVFTTPGYVLTNSGSSTIYVTNPATLISVPAGTTTIGAPITGEGLVVNGPGTLVLSGANTYAAGTVISNQATVSVSAIADSGTSGISTAPVTFAGGTLAYTGSTAATTARHFLGIPSTTNAINVPSGISLTLNSQVNGTSPGWLINKTGTGTLTLGGTGDNSWLGMNVQAGTLVCNKITTGACLGGPVSVSGGATLQLSGNGYGKEIYSGNTTPVSIYSGGLFDLNGQSNTLYTLALAGNGIGGGVVINSASGTSSSLVTPITLNANTTIGGTGNITLLGIISGNPSLTQAGTGLLTLGGTSTFYGGLNLNPNTVVMLASNQAAGLGPISIGANAILMVNVTNNNSALANPIVGGPLASIDVLANANANTGISGDLSGFTGQLNCPASASTAKVQFTVSESFSINPAAIINVSNGATLYIANHNVVVPCTVNMFGTGNSEAYGALRIESGALISGPVNLYGNTTMGDSPGGAAGIGTISGVISSIGGNYGITFQPVSGTIQLAGANTYSGTTTLNGCVVQLDSAETPGTSGPLGNPATAASSIVFSGGGLQFTSANNHDYSARFSTAASQKYALDVNGQTVTLATPLSSGGGSLLLQSSVAGGKLILSGANTYTGPTTNSSGTIQLAVAENPGVSGPLGDSAATVSRLVSGPILGGILMSGGTLQYTPANAGDYSGRFVTNNSQAFNLDINGQNVSYANPLISPSGTLNLSSTAGGGSLTLSGTNTYSGATTINPTATLIVAGAGDLGNASGVGNYTAAISDEGTFIFGSSSNQTLSGAITGNGSLIVSGTGMLTLNSAANAYYGGTTVSNGTLVINTAGAIAGNVTVASGVLTLSNSTALSANAVLSLPASPAAGTVVLNFSGAQTISALSIGTTNMPPGTYGAIGTAATYTSAAFTGTGILNVAGQVAYWDPSSLIASPGSGGTGGWDNSTLDWWVSGSSDSVWAGTNTAFFAGTAGTVSVNANVSANGLFFTAPNYIVGGSSTLTLLNSTSNGTPVISIPAGSTTISCPIASSTTSNSIIINGPGTLTLSADNSAGLTNNLEVTGGGTLSVNSIEDGGNGASAIGNGANLMLFDGNLAFTGTSGQSSRHITISGPYSNTISVLPGNTLEFDGQVQNIGGTAPQVLAFTGGGTLIFGGAVDNASLDVVILAGTLQLNKANLGSTGHGIGGGTSIVGSGATLQLAGSGSQLYSGTVLTINNGGTFDLNGQAQFSTGALTLMGDGGGGGALINSSYGPAYLTNSITLAGNTMIGGNGSMTLSAVISGIGPSLTYAGTSGAELYLDGANTWSGGLIVAAGSTVALNSLTGAGSGPITLESGGVGGPGSGGSLILPTSGNGYGSSYFNPVNGDSTTTINITSAGTANIFIEYNLTNFQGTINCGNGGSSNPQVLLTSVNNEAYPISPNATWNIANGTTLDFQAPCTVDPANVIVNGIGNNIFGSLRMDACNQQGNVLLNGSNCQIGDGNTPPGASTISGVISDGGNGYGFTKVGAVGNTIILTAANTYAGPTVVSNGVLALAGSGSIATSSGLTLMGGTTLDVSGVTAGSYTLGSSQALNCYGTATIAGNLTLSSGMPVALQCTNIGTGLIVTNGTLTLNDNPMTVTVYSSLGVPISPVPGTYPLITTVASITGAGPGLLGGSVSGSSLTVASLNPAFNASLSISNNTLYMIIGASAPTIVGQLPLSAGGPATLLYAGASPNFSVQAVGLAPLQYLWYTNNALVGYATNASMTLTNVQIGALSTYCIVSNSASYTPALSLTWMAYVTNDPTAPYPALVLADQPLGYWRLNETEIGGGDAGVIAEDYLGNNDGVYTNITLGNPGYTTNNVPDSDPTETSAEFGALAFSDCNAYGIPGVNFGSPSGASATFSIEAWVNGYTQTKDAGIVSLGYGGGGEQFDLDTGNDTVNHGFRFFVRDAAGATHASTSAIVPNGAWHHLVGVCDESNGVVTLYVDGVVATSGSGSITPRSGLLASTRNMIIGSRPAGSTTDNNDQFVGYINDVAVYSYALSATQVVAHYVSAGVPPSFAQLPPATVNAVDGQSLSLPATAIGTPPLLYVWTDLGAGTNLSSGLTNGNVISASQAISSVPSSWNGDTLSLTVSNAYGQTTIMVTLNVASYLQASLAPSANVSLVAGESYTLTAAASGSLPITYQWSSNGVPVTGAASPTLLALAPLGDTTYSCLVSNPSGTTNLSVTLTGLPYLTLDWNGGEWAANQSGNYSGTPFNNGVLTLTDGGGSEVRSAFFGAPQYIGAFEASFTYQAGGNKTADGTTFCLQNDPRGPAALGGGGGSLGVSGISPSAELELNLYTGGHNGVGYAWETNGVNGGAATNFYTPTGSLAFNSGNPINVSLYYSQGVLSMMAVDTVTANSFSTNLSVGDLTAIVGGNTAYVGFTGASGGSTAVQTISGFTFVSLMDLATQISGTNMVLNWPAEVSLYQLQSTADLSSPNWVNVTNGVTTIGNQNQVTLPVTGGQEFYRLQLQ